MEKRFAVSFLTMAAALILLFAALIFAVDPFYQYRAPKNQAAAPLFSERYQLPGVARNFDYDAALIGSSMAENNRASWYSEAFSCSARKFTFAGGYFPEYDAIFSEIYAGGSPRYVFFSLDLYALMADPGYAYFTLPAYLYGENVLDDASYLFNKDVLLLSIPEYLEKQKSWTAADADDAFSFADNWVPSKATAIHNYLYEDFLWFNVLATDDYTACCAENLSYLTRWAAEHPETEFYVFLPPYSVLMWEKCRLDGTQDAVVELLATCADELLPYENIRFFSFLDKADAVENLDNYMDSLHFSRQLSRVLVDDMKAGNYEVTKQNRDARIESLRAMLDAYDFDALEREIGAAA